MEFVKIPGIPGEATDKDHAGWILAHGTTFQGDPAALGPGELIFKKGVDKGSGALAEAARKRSKFARVLVDVATGRITLEDVHIPAILKREGGSGMDPGEDVTLSYARRAPQKVNENELRPEKTPDLSPDAVFLQLPGVPGDSSAAGHSNWIDVRSFSLAGDETIGGETRPAPDGQGSAVVTKLPDSASPKLQIAAEWSSLTIEALRGTTLRTIRLVQPAIIRVRQILISEGSGTLWGEEIAFSHRGRQESFRETKPAAKPDRPPASDSGQRGFLQLPGISGDAKDTQHMGWIELRRLGELRADPATAKVFWVGDDPWPNFVPAKQTTDGELRVIKLRDSATSKLRAAFDSRVQFDSAIVDLLTGAATQRITLERVSITAMSFLAQSDRRLAPNRELPGEEITLHFERVRSAPPKKLKRPASHPVTRAHASAATEHSTINLRPPKFFELALPLLTGENGRRMYPPETGTLRLASRSGYNRSYSISDGIITDDQFCSFRFYDISEKSVDELFSATLEHAGASETIFKDRRVATYIQSARESGKYETAFAPPPVAQAGAPRRDELLAPAADEPANTRGTLRP